MHREASTLFVCADPPGPCLELLHPYDRSKAETTESP